MRGTLRFGASLLTLAGCSAETGESAADTGDTGCVRPSGLLPEGVWMSDELSMYWVEVEATGEAYVYQCEIWTTVEVASVDAGHIAWDVTWITDEQSDFGYDGPGTITGEVCGDVASLLMSPVAASQNYTRGPEGSSGAGCD